MKQTLTGSLAILALAMSSMAHAVDLSQSDLESRQRSKVVKMKAKNASTSAQNYNFLAAQGQSESEECGSQSIGNVSTNRRAGPAPREVFVFAPGAINIVSSNGCR
jgi:hypothetical protein